VQIEFVLAALAQALNYVGQTIESKMENIQIIDNFADIVALSRKKNKTMVLSLELGDYSSLMYQVVETYLEENPEAFSWLKIAGRNAQKIQEELSILQLPALILIEKGNIIAIFQGMVAKHEIQKALSKNQ